jgi:hypothetical protein
MSDKFELSRVVNLRSAEATVYLHTERQGDEGRVMWEIFPAAYSGNSPGVLYRIMQGWEEAIKTAVALRQVAAYIHDGLSVVPGTNAAPVMLYLQAAGEFGAGLRLVLTEEDALTLMNELTTVAEHATKAAPIVVATKLPGR